MTMPIADLALGVSDTPRAISKGKPTYKAAELSRSAPRNKMEDYASYTNY